MEHQASAADSSSGSYVAVIGSTLPLDVAKVYWLVGTFLIFPLAVAISHLWRADPFCKGNDLGELVSYTT
jgi:hypothetical protein